MSSEKHSYKSVLELLEIIIGQSIAAHTMGSIIQHFSSHINGEKGPILPTAKIDILGYSLEKGEFFPSAYVTAPTENNLLNDLTVYPFSMLRDLQKEIENYINISHEMKGKPGYLDFFRNFLLGPDYPTKQKSQEEILEMLKDFLGNRNEVFSFHLSFYYSITHLTNLNQGYYFNTQKNDFIPISENGFGRLQKSLSSLTEPLINKFKKYLFETRYDPSFLMELFSSHIEKRLHILPLFATYHSFKTTHNPDNQSIQVEEEGFLIKNRVSNPKNPIFIEPLETSFLYSFSQCRLKKLLFLLADSLALDKKSFTYSIYQEKLNLFFDELTAYEKNDLLEKNSLENTSHFIRIFFQKYPFLFSKLIGFFSPLLMPTKYSNEPKHLGENLTFFKLHFLPALLRALRMSIYYLALSPLHKNGLKELYQLGIKKIFLLPKEKTEAKAFELEQDSEYSPVYLKPLFEKLDIENRSLPCLFLLENNAKLTESSTYQIQNFSYNTHRKLKISYEKISMNIIQAEALTYICLDYKKLLNDRYQDHQSQPTHDQTFKIKLIETEIKLVDDLIRNLMNLNNLPQNLDLFMQALHHFQESINEAEKSLKTQYPRPLMKEIIHFFKPEPPATMREIFLNDCHEILNLSNIRQSKDKDDEVLLETIIQM